jgi:hypothetical protein
MSIQEAVWIKICCREKGRKETSSIPDLASDEELVSQINIIYMMSVGIHKIRMPIG